MLTHAKLLRREIDLRSANGEFNLAVLKKQFSMNCKRNCGCAGDGVTLSGGECLAQPDFAAALAEELYKKKSASILIHAVL